jgi:hypothetical protein
MKQLTDIARLGPAIAARTAAYAEEGAALRALDEAERRLKAATRDASLYADLNPDTTAIMREREVTARLRREQAVERLSEARRDLQLVRQLSNLEIVRTKE